MKTGAIFIDLSAAYDTVWRWGLMLKTARMVKCKRTLRLLLVMTGTRHFHICLGEQVSRTRTIKNGVPQGSVLAPTLFNIYLCDIPDTASQKFGYADDWAITSQSGSIKDLERTLTEDAASLHNYFEKWYLKMNTTKSVTTLFHLDNNSANQSLDVQIYGNPLPPDKHPKYLGGTLDRSLTYKQHIDKTTQKLNKRISLIRKLAGTNWGAHQSVLRTSSIALCYSVAEYCAPTWERSAHAKKIDVQLNKVMRIISGATQPTPTIWLPTMCNIEPPHLRRKNATQVAHSKAESLPQDAPLTIVLQRAPNTSRLKSRKPFYKSREVDFRLGEEWEHFWEENVPTRGYIITNPTALLPGFSTATRRMWVSSNRLIAGHGRTAANLNRWGLRDSPTCPKCLLAPQDTNHLVLDCPYTQINGGYAAVLECGDMFEEWLASAAVEV